MKKIIMPLTGTLAIIVALVLNVHHAVNEYGILENKTLHVEVLAQSTTGDGTGTGTGTADPGTGTGTGSGSLTIYKKKTGPCSITLEGSVGTTFRIKGTNYRLPLTGRLTITFDDVAVDCEAGGPQMCVYKDCASFWAE